LTVNKSLSINTGKVQRLNSGIGLLVKSKRGASGLLSGNDVALLSLVTTDAIDAKNLPGFLQCHSAIKAGVTIWRYKPGTWDKPIAVTDA
jgi:hypothetical protein